MQLKDKIYISGDNKTNLTILPKVTNNIYLLKWLPIYYNEYLIFNIPNTNLIIKNTVENILKFNITSFQNNNYKDLSSYEEKLFCFIPMDVNKTNKEVYWDEPFIIKTINNGTVFMNDNNILIVVYDKIEKLDKERIYFKLGSLMPYYYCDEKQCKTTTYDKTFKVEGSDNLKTKNSKGEPVETHLLPNCYNLCNKSTNNKMNNINITNNKMNNINITNNNNYKLLYIILCIIIITIIIILILKI
jgi:hypothetical protein